MKFEHKEAIDAVLSEDKYFDQFLEAAHQRLNGRTDLDLNLILDQLTDQAHADLEERARGHEEEEKDRTFDEMEALGYLGESS